ncbi:RNA 2',3'-cyclic phosphodiesterase [Desulfocurvus sp. DL9XJH121]
MGTMRLFTGLGLPGEYQEILRNMTGRWDPRLESRVTWTRPGNWHLTLKFLGDAPEEAVADIRAALAGVAFGPFSVRAGGAGYFPPRGEPRVFWVGLALGAEAVAGLAGEVERALAPLGFEPESRAYRPHLTLARVRRARGDDWSGMSREASEMRWPAFEVRAFTLWQSVLGPSGPSYRVIADFGATSL